MGLYDRIADEYDEITGAARRAAAAADFLRELRGRHVFDSALDVACGTGLHAVLLAAAGVRVTAGDLSEAMLDHARRRASDEGVYVRWVRSPMQQIDRHVDGPFDVIFCLGNSLPHLLEDADLDAAAAAFAGLLADGGLVAIQLLNYPRILARRERIVGITRSGDSQYVRFYDFLDERVRFNVLKMTWDGDRCRHELSADLLRPYAPDQVEAALRKHGLSAIERCGGATFEPFDEQQSDTLLILARP